MVTISRDQSWQNHSVPADDSRVLEWVTKHSTCGLQSLLSSEVDPSGQADIQFQSVTGEQLNTDVQAVVEPNVLGQVDVQSMTGEQLNMDVHTVAEPDVLGQVDIQFQSVTGEQLNMDVHIVTEPNVLGQVDIQSVMQDVREEYGVLCDVTGLFPSAA